MLDQPRKHSKFLVALALVILCTAPFPFIGAEVVIVAGLPLWLWWSLGFTVTMCAMTSWAMLNFWREDDSGEHGS